MTEVEATIPENSASITEAETNETVEEPKVPEPPESKRGRGRPAGSKDKAPRATKPKVRVEPIPQPAPKPAPKPLHQIQEAPPPTVVEERPPSPEPASPRTLFRQTSEHLLNLRDVMNSQKRTLAAERYTNRLHAWPVI